jgi:hypothetical protein
VQWRKLIRVAAHLMLAISLVLPGVAAPARAAANAFAQPTAATTTMARGGRPTACGDMGVRPDRHRAPVDPCSTHNCDLSACIGTACLPEIAGVIAVAAPTPAPALRRHPLRLLRIVDLPLRPPIG